jgi:hypothetical protein
MPVKDKTHKHSNFAHKKINCIEGSMLSMLTVLVCALRRLNHSTTNRV